MSKSYIWSLSRPEARELLKHIEVANRTDLEDLKKTIEIIQQESEILCQELKTLSQVELNSLRINSTGIHKRVEVTLGFIENTLGKDVFALQNSAQKSFLSLENNIIELHRVSKRAKKELEKGFICETELGLDNQITTSSNESDGEADFIKNWASLNTNDPNKGTFFENNQTGYWDYIPDWEEEPGDSFFTYEIAATTDPESLVNGTDLLSNPREVNNLEAEIHHENNRNIVGLPGESSENSQASVRQKINIVRNKYLKGKIAGEDLLDSSDNVIIRKNETITESVMDKAFKEGKLADLIINMASIEQEDCR